jgi:hypothetical protein
LSEIQVNDLSGVGIMSKVIASLYLNHFVQPVMYEVYVRVHQFETDYRVLHMLSEYQIYVYHDQKSKYKFQIIKMRAKPFSEVGKEYFKDMRVMDGILFDNIFKPNNRLLKNIFVQKKLRYYDITIDMEVKDEDYDVVKLRCSPKKNKGTGSIILFIDRNSFAVHKMITYTSESGEYFNEVGFKQINRKWYLDYSKNKHKASVFTVWQKDSNARCDRIAIYNINDQVEYSQDFKGVIDIIAEPVNEYIGDWSDLFWEDYNYIPLPDWIEETISDY